MNKNIAEKKKGILDVEAMRGARGYIGWSPDGDYLGGGDGFDKRMEFEDSKAFLKEFETCDDDWNQVIDFYFSNDEDTCMHCEGQGYNLATGALYKSYYYGRPGKDAWSHDITQDEVEALVKENRLMELTHVNKDGAWIRKKVDGKDYVPTAAEVNEWSKTGLGHDGINCSILVKTRAKRLGVYGTCGKCDGKGTVSTHDEVSLNIWMAHPRKGATRGIYVEKVYAEDLPKIKAFFKRSHDKFQKHFAWVLEGESK